LPSEVLESIQNSPKMGYIGRLSPGDRVARMDGTAKDTLVKQATYYATRYRKQRGIKMGWDGLGNRE
jgi:hypothetical protein